MTYTHVRDLLGLFRNGYDSVEISYIAGLLEPTADKGKVRCVIRINRMKI